MHIRSRALTSAAALCAVAALAASAGAQTTQAVQRTEDPPVLVDCLWHPEVRPADFMLACADGNSRLASLHWSRWGERSARAEGVNWVNDCKPYCAAGRFHAYPVSVRLDRPEPWKKHPQLSHYSRITLTYTEGRPEGYAATVSYPLWN
ncbi:putative secreted protein [Streptomyces davaonensis JCM 4913]|uniref:Putative secreted protein n=1 Tax=Streptomyces davaonensis (strain DSM 101723 / JCM 4913 / KCC S-0913 / 768) TaxID=1214101 RepID=K4QY80_STRDJ|nr:hypothetical protein [Streptomyces davaonensis]CCK25872.1 putative secreted protein [Streptomyces davaonensis JCM 4913]